jgi:hypothetical protein
MKAFYVRDSSGSMMAGTAFSTRRPSEDTTVVLIKDIDKGISHYVGESTNIEILDATSDITFEDCIELKHFDSLSEAIHYFLEKYFTAWGADIHTHNLVENIFIDPSQEFVGSLETAFRWIE